MIGRENEAWAKINIDEYLEQQTFHDRSNHGGEYYAFQLNRSKGKELLRVLLKHESNEVTLRILANAWLQDLWYCFEEMDHFSSEYERMQTLIQNKQRKILNNDELVQEWNQFQRYIANNCLEFAVKYKLTNYERIAVLVNSAFITLYGSRILVSKKTKNALSRPDIIELDKQTKRMRLSLDCRYIVLEETEVNPATSKKKTNTLTNCRSLEKLMSMTPPSDQASEESIYWVRALSELTDAQRLKSKSKHRHKHSSHTKSDVSKHTITYSNLQYSLGFSQNGQNKMGHV
ncbi:hypothetical protein RFI_30520 [Reticulomyxa filosa]|uniref:Uncharacterized protein n=1 Tax=Reticulomyxa filosa TaxID=46433 RepID=X6LZY2_RETFI|nr:hypothetical protein RFI_30520 [Reticulomyxa filosa]|eukprot:ETO06871.1 hypothetical protein RFI_30520 [Reticulomyxa filosa]